MVLFLRIYEYLPKLKCTNPGLGYFYLQMYSHCRHIGRRVHRHEEKDLMDTQNVHCNIVSKRSQLKTAYVFINRLLATEISSYQDSDILCRYLKYDFNLCIDMKKMTTILKSKESCLTYDLL